MAAADSSADSLRSRLRHREAVADLGRRALESADIDGTLADAAAVVTETLEIAVDSLPRVDGDPGQLRQLFRNLLDSAVTYSGNGTPRISVFAEKDETRWMVSVRDRGIDPGDTDRVFRAFDRLHSHEEDADTGIGLALCQRIVERHGVRTSDAESTTTLETDADADGRTDE